MTFTDTELQFLTRLSRGHLSTIGPDGSPQIKPLGFAYNAELGTLDITGFNMALSAKYRNVQANPRVAFVVDEVTEPTAQGAHFLEIRGLAEAVTEPAEIIRIHPRRVLSFNVDPARPGLHTRNIQSDGSVRSPTSSASWPDK
jgi:pyridoxamine 5'-phosphate oxidase family protein